jgi:nicotinamidase-related amidase
MNVYSEFLERSDCALLLVDLQKPVLDGCVNGDRVVKKSAALMDMASLLGIPMFFSVQNPEKLGGCLPELLEKVREPRVFHKMEFGCFENEAFTRALIEAERRTLLIAGIEAHVCVFHTAAQALRLGLRVHVAADAVSSGSVFDRDTGLRRLERAGAVVSSTEMIVYELLNRAGTSEFRSALPLLKKLREHSNEGRI